MVLQKNRDLGTPDFRAGSGRFGRQRRQMKIFGWLFLVGIFGGVLGCNTGCNPKSLTGTKTNNEEYD
jgi:hypothetical protein